MSDDSDLFVCSLLDKLGRTPLHIAAAKGYTDIVKLLLENGADPHAVDLHGSNPLGEAQNQKIANLLCQYIENKPPQASISYGQNSPVASTSYARSPPRMMAEQ